MASESEVRSILRLSRDNAKTDESIASKACRDAAQAGKIIPEFGKSVEAVKSRQRLNAEHKLAQKKVKEAERALKVYDQEQKSKKKKEQSRKKLSMKEMKALASKAEPKRKGRGFAKRRDRDEDYER
jgi:hypothetical protein